MADKAYEKEIARQKANAIAAAEAKVERAKQDLEDAKADLARAKKENA